VSSILDVIRGVVKLGLVANTSAPVPVSSVTAAARFADEGVPRKVATLVPRAVKPVPPRPAGSVPIVPPSIGSPVALVSVPELGVPSAPPLTTKAPAVPTFTARAVATLVPRPDTPVLIGKPVALVSVTADGVPRFGVVKTGDVAKTNEPVPVSSVTAAAKFADEGVPRKVAIPAPNEVIPVPPLATGSVPVTPVLRGRPVAFVSTPELGVPRAPPFTTNDPAVPVFIPSAVATPVPNAVIPVPPFATGKVPVTPVVSGSPVALVRTPEDGVPNAPPFTTNAPDVPTFTLNAVATLVPKPDTLVEIGNPVAFVKTPEAGVPSAGVTKVGLTK
jgi:hypothetical protein